jgi:hypothetical protein
MRADHALLLWRATFWVTGTTPPALGGSAYETTPWGAVQRAAWVVMKRDG